jgi:hypothetical protein
MQPRAFHLLTIAAIGLAASLSAPAALLDDDLFADAGRAGRESLISALNPDPAQNEKIRTILDDEAIRAAESRHATFQQILGVLSDAQRTQYETLIQQRSDQQLQQLACALDLTRAQQAELGAVLLLADERFAPSISGADLATAIRAMLTDEQAQKFAALLPD